MYTKMISSLSLICAVAFFIRPTTGHVDLPSATASHLEGERAHIGAHMGVDVNSLAEDELRFMYFRMHDADGDSRLDGCELVKSLLHWHHEESASPDHVPIFGNDELALMVDPVLSADDRNADGFIDYPEFVAAQKARGL